MNTANYPLPIAEVMRFYTIYTQEQMKKADDNNATSVRVTSLVIAMIVALVFGNTLSYLLGFMLAVGGLIMARLLYKKSMRHQVRIENEENLQANRKKESTFPSNDSRLLLKQIPNSRTFEAKKIVLFTNWDKKFVEINLETTEHLITFSSEKGAWPTISFPCYRIDRKGNTVLGPVNITWPRWMLKFTNFDGNSADFSAKNDIRSKNYWHEWANS